MSLMRGLVSLTLLSPVNAGVRHRAGYPPMTSSIRPGPRVARIVDADSSTMLTHYAPIVQSYRDLNGAFRRQKSPAIDRC